MGLSRAWEHGQDSEPQRGAWGQRGLRGVCVCVCVVYIYMYMGGMCVRSVCVTYMYVGGVYSVCGMCVYVCGGMCVYSVCMREG